jgi:hypothetical protein
MENETRERHYFSLWPMQVTTHLQIMDGDRTPQEGPGAHHRHL